MPKPTSKMDPADSTSHHTEMKVTSLIWFQVLCLNYMGMQLTPVPTIYCILHIIFSPVIPACF